jgi:transposase
MTVHPRPIPPIPADTVRVARAAFPKGNPYLRLRDTLGAIFTDQALLALYSRTGQPGYAPWRVALITLMQFAEGLSDRQAADAVRSRIDWKYALSLPLEDAGFDASVLSEFRDRLGTADPEHLLLLPLLERCRELGLLRERGRQRTDATHVVAAVRQLNRLELVGETMRRALDALAVAVPDWLRTHAADAWLERYERRLEEYRLPKSEPERAELAQTIGEDGFQLLQVLTAEDAPPWLGELPAIRRLQQIWSQQYDPITHRFREIAELPAAAELLASPVDEEARWGAKRQIGWAGYKAHLTETCEADLPHLVTHVESTVATVPDQAVLDRVHAGLAERTLLPALHLVDGGYPDADALAQSPTRYGIDLLGPAPPDPSWQAKANEGFALTDFTLDWEREVALCPQGQQSGRWRHRVKRGQAVIAVKFGAAACRACPVRPQCTRSASAPRTLMLLPKEQTLALQAARQRQETPAFREQYRARAGIEGTLSQAVRRSGLRRTRYVGLAKVHVEHCAIAAALNVGRISDWLAGTPRARTRRSHFAQIMAQAA